MTQILKEKPSFSIKGKYLKIFYGTQTSTSPVEFTLFINSKDYIKKGYGKYLNSQLKEKAGFTLVPVSVNFKAKEKYGERKRQ